MHYCKGPTLLPSLRAPPPRHVTHPVGGLGFYFFPVVLLRPKCLARRPIPSASPSCLEQAILSSSLFCIRRYDRGARAGGGRGAYNLCACTTARGIHAFIHPNMGLADSCIQPNNSTQTGARGPFLCFFLIYQEPGGVTPKKGRKRSWGKPILLDGSSSVRPPNWRQHMGLDARSFLHE
jgi:hypothetical protein